MVGTVLLVSCYELGHRPLGVASAAGFLERAGHAVEALDIAVEPFDEEKARRARLVAISVPMHTALRLGLRVAQRVREENPRCHICFFGLYASLNAAWLLEHVADSCLGGEFEEALVSLADEVAAGRGAALPQAGAETAGTPIVRRLSFAAPSWKALPGLERYVRVAANGHLGRVGQVQATRGCKHHCTHCPIPPLYGGRFLVVPREVVLDSVRQHVAAGAEHITFSDPDFLNGPGHAMAVARALHEAFPSLTFDFTAKIEHLLNWDRLLPELRSLGCLFITSAVESLSDRVLGILRKGHTRADVSAALRACRDAGIALRPTWVAFTPWTGLQDYLEMLQFVDAEGIIDCVDPVQYAVRLLVPPGSSLATDPQMAPYLGPLVAESFCFPWTHPDPRMDALHRAVCGQVERAAKSRQDPWVTFHEIWSAAAAVGGGEAPVRPVPEGRRTSPRLTEDWFC